jgi:hypothetical protein
MNQRENCCELMCFGAELVRIWCELSSVRVGIGDEHSWCSYQFLEIFWRLISEEMREKWTCVCRVGRI